MNKKGFTLMEMLVVIMIIAVLVSILVPAVGNATGKARAAADAANLRSATTTYQIGQSLGGQDYQCQSFENATLAMFQIDQAYAAYFVVGTGDAAQYYGIDFFSAIANGKTTEGITTTAPGETNLLAANPS